MKTHDNLFKQTKLHIWQKFKALLMSLLDEIFSNLFHIDFIRCGVSKYNLHLASQSLCHKIMMLCARNISF